MRLVRREKPPTEKPLTEQEIDNQLLADYQNPTERGLNEPTPAPVEPPAEPSGETEADTEIPAGDDAGQ